MSFFDGLPASPPPPEPPDETLELRAYAPAEDEEFAPSHWFVPARLPQVAEAGAGPDVRIVLTGWEVWPRSVTMRLSLFLRRIRPGGRTSPYGGPRDGALRCGLMLADGRKVTTLDGAPLPTAGPPHPTLRLGGGSGGAFHYELELHLSQLPPAGATQLVVEWPDEQVPETVTVFDAGPLRAAAGEALEIWPDAAPPAPPAPPTTGEESRGFLTAGPGPAEILAPPPESEPQPWSPPAPHPARGDWELLAPFHWRDTALVLARLANGADPQALVPGHPQETPLHLAAAHGSPESVAALLDRGAAVDAPDAQGCTPLWHAVCHGAEENAALLLRAGADAWSPQVAGRSPGRLALTCALAPLFAGLPGAVPLTPEERAAQRAADEQAAVFRGAHTDGASVAFVVGIDEAEAVRRLGRDPRDCPVLAPDADADPDATGPYGFDAHDAEESHRRVGVTGVPGGCVLRQPSSYLLSTDRLLDALSVGTAAYGLYVNPAGGTFGTLSRDGRTALTEEIGLPPYGDEPEGHWHYRFWSWSRPKDMYGANELGYAAATAGLRVTDPAPVTGPPRRWVEIPDGSGLLG
ncbi:ankyrin repeat domain-containing protein [Streptomyces sp. A1-5]|uniref:ankyrin repeat domain-containing protein n=1 Tax=Streptomyces sp. A1-5 TaxID=2738410 RepID=UPI001F157C6E|nr:ankyrin repeat domain-containing protein [Streptomyces sp. A1-5]UJB44192.1 ankyrin repeat domain-containing protein [Streptomyces sp. A1-5]